MSGTVTVVGAGLAGSLLAALLARQGFAVEVYERRPDMRIGEPPRGRSINLALSARGLHALDQVGMREAVTEQGIPMYGRMIHDAEGGRTLQRYSIHADEFLWSVSRHGLNVALIDAAERAGVRFRFGQKLAGMDLAAGTLELHDEATGAARTVDAPCVIGADGAWSAVRAALQKRDRFDYHQDFLHWGYKELATPPAAAAGGGWRFEPNALHIWPRHDFMLIALPNQDGSFTCTLFLPFEGRHGFEGIRSDEDVAAFFGEHFPDALPHMPTLLEDYRHNPTSSLVYLRCFPWHVDGRVCLVGDACHAVVPFYGQGMNAAFEDCAVLAACLEKPGTPTNSRGPEASDPAQATASGWKLGTPTNSEEPETSEPPARDRGAEKPGTPTNSGANCLAEPVAGDPASGISGCPRFFGEAFARYEALRKPNTDALADLSLHNFVEMRHGVVSPAYRVKKRVETALHRLFPRHFLPLYSMVTFRRIPYAEAVARARRQDRLLAALGLGGAAGLAAAAAWLWRRGRDRAQTAANPRV